MPMTILDECTGCAACEAECPTDAISRGDEVFVVDAALCTDCHGEHDHPKCAELCPVEGAIAAAS